MSITANINDPGLNKVKDNGQNESYLVLSEEERAKEFIRPLRTTYKHVGRLFKPGENGEIKLFDEPNGNYVGYFKLNNLPGGPSLTARDIEIIKKEGNLGGCGAETIMNQAIAETYARDPKFYGATFCTGCGTHLPVSEFVWLGTDERVGS